MYQRAYCAVVFFLFMIVSLPVAAADSNCSYSTRVKLGDTTFDVSSRPVQGCAVHIITVTASRNGRKMSELKADVDYLATSARSIDLTGDGTQELIVISRPTRGMRTESLDVYWLEGTTMYRAMVPDLEEKSGYKGEDRFYLEGRAIVRSFPVYNDGDTAGKPSGGTRLFMYEFKEGKIIPVVSSAKAGNSSENSTVPNTVPSTPVAPIAPIAKKSPVVSAALYVTEIATTDSGVEIRTNGTTVKYKTMRLEKPERIAIDIPGADSSLAGKKITINRFGISTARIGRNKGFLRIVLDTNLGTFPKHQVNSSDTGVLIVFPQ